MTIFRITLTDCNSRGQRLWVNLESSAASLAELMQRLAEDRVLYGRQLFTRFTAGTRQLEVTHWREIILGREAIYKIEVPEGLDFDFSQAVKEGETA